MQHFFLYVILYYIITLSMVLVITRKLIKFNYLQLLLLSFYLIIFIVGLFGFLQDINIINSELISCIEESNLDIELPEIDNSQLSHNTPNNWGTLFLNKFSQDSYFPNITVKFQDIHFYNKYNINIESWKTLDKLYYDTTFHNKEVLFFIDNFLDILQDLESIQKDLSKGM